MVVWTIILILCGLATPGDAQTANETTVNNVTLPENDTAPENDTTLTQEDDTTPENDTTLTQEDDTTPENDTTLTQEDDTTPEDVETNDAIKSDVNTSDVETAPAETSDDVVNEEDEDRREEIEGELFRQIIDYEGRPMPPELSLLIQNNTQDADELQECMKEFADCLNMHKFYPFCGISLKLKKVRRFDTMCEFNYAICKEGPDSWKYAMDEDCDIEKVQEVIKEAVAEAATKTTENKTVDESETERTVEEQETTTEISAPPEFGGKASQNNSTIQRMKLYYRALADADNADDDDD